MNGFQDPPSPAAGRSPGGASPAYGGGGFGFASRRPFSAPNVPGTGTTTTPYQAPASVLMDLARLSQGTGQTPSIAINDWAGPTGQTSQRGWPLRPGPQGLPSNAGQMQLGELLRAIQATNRANAPAAAAQQMNPNPSMQALQNYRQPPRLGPSDMRPTGANVAPTDLNRLMTGVW